MKYYNIGMYIFGCWHGNNNNMNIYRQINVNRIRISGDGKN